MTQLWRLLAPLLDSHLEGNLRLVLDLDDTLFHKAGRKVNGAGSFRERIRSRGQRTVFAHGLNLVVLTLRVQPPWGGEPIGLPINMRRHSKRDGRSLLDLGQEMIAEVPAGCPTTRSSSAATAPTPARPGATCLVVSRIQRNAALYEPAPPGDPVSAAGRARRAPASAPPWSSPRPSTAGPWPTSTCPASRSSALCGHDHSCGTVRPSRGALGGCALQMRPSKDAPPSCASERFVSRDLREEQIRTLQSRAGQALPIQPDPAQICSLRPHPSFDPSSRASRTYTPRRSI
jgi:hypothetical protein